MKKLLTKIIFVNLVFILSLVFVGNSAWAVDCDTIHVNNTGLCVLSLDSCPADKQGIDTSRTDLCPENFKCCYKVASTSSTELQSESPDNIALQVPIFDFGTANNVVEYIIKIYQYVLIILVPFAIIMLIIGGIQWILAAGEGGKIKLAQKQIISAVVGLLIGLFSYVLLSLVGITSIKQPYVENIPEVFINNETTGADLCDSSKPYCGSSSTRLDPFRFNDFFIKSAEAAYTKPPVIKQHDPKWAHHKYGICGTIKTSGCGITSLTMAISYLTGQLAPIESIADLAATSGYRKCTGDGGWDEAKQDCRTCAGTDYKALNTGSAILNKYGLKGKNLMGKGAVTNIVNAIKANGVVIISVSGVSIGDSKHPVTKANNRFTAAGHFILLFGCTDCDNADPSKVIIGVNDPNFNNTYITKKELLTTGFLRSAYQIYK